MKACPILIALFCNAAVPTIDGFAVENDSPTIGYLNHFWYVRTGFQSTVRQSWAPKDSEAGLILEAVETSDHRLQVQPGLVLELPKNDQYAALTRLEFLGAADSQMNSWKSFWEEKDYNHFPLALHKIEQSYRLQSQFDYFLMDRLTLGVEADYDYTRGGFTLGRKQRDLESRNGELSQSYRLKPKVNFGITASDHLELYTLFFKNLDKTSDLNTFKTYDSSHKSFGLQYQREWNEPELALRLHGFRYQFVFNDLSKDFSRTGLMTELKYRLLDDKLTLTALGGYWQDRFELPTPRIRDCQSSIVENSDNQALVYCSRQDHRTSIGAQVEYDIQDALRVSFRYTFGKNQNDSLKVHDFDQQGLLLALTWSGVGSQDYLPKHENERLEGLDLWDGR